MSTLRANTLSSLDDSATVNVSDLAKVPKLLEKLGYVKLITDFAGVDPTGVNDSTAQFVEAMVSGSCIVIPAGVTLKVSPTTATSGFLIVDGTLVINGTCNIGCDVHVRSGAVNVNAGFTATFSGNFIAPVTKIFNGSGTVSGIKEVWPEWWGAKYDTSLSIGYSDQIMAAYNCITGTQNFSRGIMHMNAYTIDKLVTFNLKTNNSVYFVGGGNNLVGGRLKLLSTFTDAIAVQFTGNADSTKAIASFGMTDIAIENTTGSAASVGVRFGNSSGFISGLAKNRIVNLTTHGFPYGIDVVNSRLLSFVGCSTWKGPATTANGLRFMTGGSVTGTFVGDCDVTSCQFEPAGSGQCMQVAVSISGHQCKGVTVDKTAFYKSDSGTQLGINASNGGIIGDLFFSSSVQFDGFSNKFMSITSDGSGSIVDDISFMGSYFRGSLADSGFTLTATNGGVVSCIRYIGCWIANGASTVFAANGCTNVQICNCHFYDTTGTTSNVMSFTACNSFSITGNVASRSGSSYFARFILVSGASDYYVVANNIASGIPATAVVTDSGTGTHKTVSGNI